MGLTHYLAMTGLELETSEALPPAVGWMACHFSPYGTGLSNLPQKLPEEALLILDDSTPIHRHEPEVIAGQLMDMVNGFHCCGVLLDFQRPGYEECQRLVSCLADALPCSIAVSPNYGGDIDGIAVFLPPVPCYETLEDYLSPWKNREIWLETALEKAVITMTEDGCRFGSEIWQETMSEGFLDPKLHCHYTAAVSEQEVQFRLWRTAEDHAALLEEAEKLGVSKAVGLYQEWGSF